MAVFGEVVKSQRIDEDGWVIVVYLHWINCRLCGQLHHSYMQHQWDDQPGSKTGIKLVSPRG